MTGTRRTTWHCIKLWSLNSKCIRYFLQKCRFPIEDSCFYFIHLPQNIFFLNGAENTFHEEQNTRIKSFMPGEGYAKQQFVLLWRPNLALSQSFHWISFSCSLLKFCLQRMFVCISLSPEFLKCSLCSRQSAAQSWFSSSLRRLQRWDWIGR